MVIMNTITYMLDKDNNVVINLLWDNNTYAAIIKPRIINGRIFIKKEDINTLGLDKPDYMKDLIISAITTQRGKYNEAPIIVDENN